MIRCRILAAAALIACGGSGDATTPREPTSIERVAGDAQQGAAGMALPIAPAVRVLDQADAPFAGAEVRFTIPAGDGATLDTLLLTDAAGLASTTWFLGPDASLSQRLRGTLVGASGSEAVVEFSAEASRPSNGESYLGRNGYIEYLPGALPIILSAPHGGTLEPDEISDRTGGTTVRDANTEELARVVADVFEERTGARPHLILCLLRRTKLDANREVVEAAAGDAEAERAWFEYHSSIDAARAAVRAEHGGGLYLDLHGHGHEIQRVEVGYLLSSSDLALPDATLDQSAFINKSSVRAIAEANPDEPFSALVRGPTSFGSSLAGAGYRSVPSADDPHPDGAPYFSGGYSTARHGSSDGGTISGLQLELNMTGVRDTEENRRQFAEALVEVVLAYVEERLGLDLLAARP